MGIRAERELIENQLRLVMVDRMLKEKYNEIEYLAIQPPADPNIVEINREDLDWLLSEHEKCEVLEQELQQQREMYENKLEVYERQKEEQREMYENKLEVYERQKEEQIEQYNRLESQYEEVMNSNAWRWGLRFAKVIHFFLTPIRALRGNK